jgi:hypothetical protein
MVTVDHAAPAGAPPIDRALPPITELAVGSMALIIIGGIYLASHLPTVPPLLPAVALLVLAVILLAVSLAMLRTVNPFAWGTFSQVVRWTLLVYAIIAGMLEYVFVVDGTRGGALLVLTLSLLMFAFDVPLILAFSVARYQPTD